jgi:hypothetical protein
MEVTMSYDPSATPPTAPVPDQQAVATMIAARLQQGAPEAMIVSEAMSMGLAAEQAQALVRFMIAAGRSQTLTGGAIAGSLIAGGVAAAISAAAWIALVMFTKRELGLAAWGIGLLVGAAVRLGSGGRRGRALQAMAAIWAFLGVALAKAIMIGLVYMADPAKASFTDVLGGYDILWVLFAVGTAWQMLQAQVAVRK